MKVDDLIEKVNSNSTDYQYWLDLEQEVYAYLQTEASLEEREKLRRKAQLEKLYMICQGIRWEREHKAP